MDVSPFPYQGPLRPEEVRGRDELLDRLTAQVTARNVTALIGPRRYGKTSVLRRLASDLSELSTVWLDLYGASSPTDMAVALDGALANAGAITDVARAVAAGLEVNLGLVKASLARPARQRPDPEALYSALLDVLVEAALRTPTLLVVDEFSAIAAVPHAAAKLRTAVQHHYREIGIVFAGSAPSVMRQLFTSREEPFYGQADLVEIDRLSGTAVDEVVAGGFRTTGRAPGIAVPRILGFARGHPQRTMQTADAVWRHTDLKAAVSEDVWSAARASLRQSVADPLMRIYDAHADSERRVLRIVANRGSATGTMGAQLGLSKSSASRARQALLDQGDLLMVEGNVVLTDPFMSDWLRETLPIP